MKKLTMLAGAITLLAGTTLFAVNTNEPVVNKNINEKFNYSMNMEGRGRHHFPRGYWNDGRMGYIQNKEIERNRIDIMEKRLELRKELKYPPFCDIIGISFQGEKIEEIITLSNLVYNTINSKVKKEQKQQIVQVFKPMPAPIDKIQNNFRWRMILKTNKLNEIQEILNLSLNEIYQLPYKKTRVSIDINPYTML